MTTNEPGPQLVSTIRRRRAGECAEVAAQIREFCHALLAREDPAEQILFHDAEVLMDANNKLHQILDRIQKEFTP